MSVRPTLPSRSLAPTRATDLGRKMASRGRSWKCFQKSWAVWDDLDRRWWEGRGREGSGVGMAKVVVVVDMLVSLFANG